MIIYIYTYGQYITGKSIYMFSYLILNCINKHMILSALAMPPRRTAVPQSPSCSSRALSISN